jgi:glycolate oxidase iron-sulfur subunit
VTPPEQTCCGALHFHTGERERGLELLGRNLRAFDLRDVDALVVNAAGCGSTLKEYGSLAAETTAIAAAASALASRTQDISEFLHGLGLVPPSHSVPVRVAYDEPCHLLHGQRVSAAPRAMLAAIPGATLVPLADADRCCGSAGVYNLVQPELATAVLEEKVRAIAASGAEVVASGNPGCILWIRRGLAAAAAAEPRLATVRVVHPMELLARAYGMEM